MAVNVDNLVAYGFPLRKGPTGYLAIARGADVVPEAIEQVLGTVPGERPMRPTFGCDLHRHLFQPADQRQAETTKSDIAEALRRWVPWIVVDGGTRGVEVEIDGHTVSYRVKYRIGNGPQQVAEGEIELRT